jgi:hypothetical protein
MQAAGARLFAFKRFPALFAEGAFKAELARPMFGTAMGRRR